MEDFVKNQIKKLLVNKQKIERKQSNFYVTELIIVNTKINTLRRLLSDYKKSLKTKDMISIDIETNSKPIFIRKKIVKKNKLFKGGIKNKNK